MKYFIPRLILGADLPPQTKAEDKVGGLPWGLSTENYPRCRSCGKSQSFLIQLMHHPERLDLGRQGRSLFVFQCTHDLGNCTPWAGGSGSNACFVLEPEALLSQLTPMPNDVPADTTWLNIEARITDWIAQDDGVPPERVTPDGQLVMLPGDEDEYIHRLESSVYSELKIGSLPWWVQDSYEAPRPEWKFAVQLAEEIELAEEPSIKGLNGHIYQRQDGRWGCTGPNLGCGIGYVFIRPQAGIPDGWFFWQC
jgi:hypothetical protein